MSGIFKVIQSWFTQFMLVIKSSDIIDLLDIIIVAFIIYKLVQIVRQTRAKQIIYGVLIIVGAWAVSSWLDMIALHSMLNIVIGQGVIALAVIFQPEIRSALTRQKGEIGRFYGDRIFYRSGKPRLPKLPKYKNRRNYCI